jgi:colanic acid/amylovoran biosynthesis glycosyltransferase
VGIYQKLFAAADLFTANSDYTQTRLEQLGCPREKIHKLPVGLNPDEFPFRERRKMTGEPYRVVTIGRLVEIKGHEYVIRAVAALREKVPSLRYDIVGDGPLRAKLEGLVRELRLSDCVGFRGALAEDSIKQILAEADVFVLASVTVEGDQEGQGLVLQEAQAMGLPVIATQHGAFPEGVLAEESAFLVPQRDIAALAERLEYLATHPEIWSQMGRAGRIFIRERYDIRQLNSRLLELYGKAMEEFGKHAS